MDILSSGCWCNMIDNFDKRHGHPVGAMDTACRAHMHCNKCLGMDFQCTPSLNTYQVRYTRISGDFNELLRFLSIQKLMSLHAKRMIIHVV